MGFNLLDERWIPVLRCDGDYELLGIRRALTEAGSIRQIAASSPLDAFAIHRFLLTLLYWKASVAGGVVRLGKVLQTGAVPPDITSALNADEPLFELVGEKQSFLQDTTARDGKTKSAGSLYAEMACGTNVAHFHHGDDANLRLCLPCAAMGMLRLVPWTQSGGAGLSPAVHNAPPIMACARGRNLGETLRLNLVPLDAHPGAARWSGCFAPRDADGPIPYLEALTWNPRRVHLGQSQSNGMCWRCGRRGIVVVGPIVYAKNDKTKSNKRGGKTSPFIWQDPAAFYDSDAPYITIKSYDEALCMDGRDLSRLLGQDESHPTSIVQTHNLAHEDWQLVVPCTNRAKIYDHRQIELRTKLSPDAIRELVPAAPSPWRQRGIDGWTEWRTAGSQKGAIALVESAVRLLTQADWVVLASAAHRMMHESPAAFDLLCALLWSLRARKVSGLPARNVAWLVLKLMAFSLSRARVPSGVARFCPLDALSKRQLDERRGDHRVRSPYPITLPRGPRLEAALRNEIDHHLRRRTAAPIDWPGLCYRLNNLLD